MSEIAEWDQTETLIRNYWLGRIVPGDLDEFENTWFGSDENAEIAEAVRDDLIQDFLGDDLNTEDKAAFKDYFLNSPAHARMLAVTGAYRSLIASEAKIAVSENAAQPGPGIFERVTALLGSLVPRPAHAFAYSAGLLLIIGFAVVFLLRRDNTVPETARIDTAANLLPEIPLEPQKTPAGADNTESVNPPPKKASNDATKETRTPNEKPKLSILAFHLTPGMRSGGGVGNTIELVDNVGTVRISVDTPGIEKEGYQEFFATIEVYKQNRVLTRKLPNLYNIQKGSQLTVDVPARVLRPGKYILNIVGKQKGIADDNLLSQSFDVKR